MARKHIFEIISGKMDLYEEITRLEQLAKMYIVELDGFYSLNLKDFIDQYCLYDWKNRNSCISYDDMRNKLNISEFQLKRKPSNEQMLVYIEFMANMLYIAKKGFDKFCAYEYEGTDAYLYIKENLNLIANNMNMEFKIYEDMEQVWLVEKNLAATDVAEIVETEISYDVIQYNHYLLKGDVEGKRRILKTLANKFEEIRPDLRQGNYSKLESNTGFLLNKLNIRHNNISGKNEIAYVKNMSKEELEKWYDETYQMILLSILTVDNIERNKKVDELKQIIEGK